MPRGSIVGLLLAAGSSSRMGGEQHKLTLPMSEGRSLVASVFDAIQGAGIDPVFVVTGFDPASMGEALAGREWRSIHHPGWEEGMGSSIAAGVRGILEEEAPAAIVVSVADLPGLRPEHLAPLVEAFRSAETEGCICVPTHRARPGHPVLFGSAYFAELASLEGDRGGRSILDTNRERVREVEIESDAILRDLDTPADLEAWRRS